ncbi:MAG: ferrous iron transport protein B, partial [Verrucomicrobiales bacterium]|nr:ferrous iron transport protein B [Verrucomicrobiales bacterium]
MGADSTGGTTTDAAARLVVLTGNPNCGKTTLFNALTGMRAKVGNYAGVTVERKEGRLRGTPPHVSVTVLDLPGSYSLSPQSPDEAVARDVLLQMVDNVPTPDVVLVVLDASNLERNLYYATQVIELGYPTVLVLNMVDVARENGLEVDPDRLSAELGVPVVTTVASRGEGLEALKTEIRRTTLGARPAEAVVRRPFVEMPPVVRGEWGPLSESLARLGVNEKRLLASAEAQMLLSEPVKGAPLAARFPPAIREDVQQARQRIESAGVDWVGGAIEARYARVGEVFRAATSDIGLGGETFSDRVDQVVTHRYWGPLIFVGLMFLMFQAIFTFAEAPMRWIEAGVGWLGTGIGAWIPEGDLRDLLQDGVIAGVGAVLVFLPQILLLFLFISLLEDTGYMARAAFLMDRLMSKVGLHGKSFIPLLSSFACAIPGIMATRTIETPKDRLATILVAPLMSCSARLPVYTVLIAAFVPDLRLLGIFKLSALT